MCCIQDMRKDREVSVHVITKPDEELEFFVKESIRGHELFSIVCHTIGLRERNYFGLHYQRPSRAPCWLRMDKRIGKELGHDIQTVKLYLMVQYYPEYVEDGLLLPLTQHLFFLHVKNQILNEDIYCPVDTAALMAAYAVQVQHGDYDKEVHRNNFLANEQLLPPRVMKKYQLSETEWEERITTWYCEHCYGLSKSEAAMEYLKLAQDLEMYGVCYYSIQNENGTNLWFGIHATGLNIYEEDNKLIPKASFLWSEISNIHFKGKQVWIQPMEKEVRSFHFVSRNVGMNQEILLRASGNHERYMCRRRPDSLEIQVMKAQAEEMLTERQREKDRLKRERKLRVQVQRSKQGLEKRLQEYQITLNNYREHLKKAEETTDLLGEKALVAEEESMLLLKKASELEIEIKRLQIACSKKEEEKGYLKSHIQSADITIQQILQESEMRAREGAALRQELDQARLSEKHATEKLLQITGQPQFLPIDVMGNQLPLMSHPRDIPSNQQLLPYVSQQHALVVNPGFEGDAPEDIRILQQERVDYFEKSHHLQQQLTELKTEIEGLKEIGGHDILDRIHYENVGKGETKYSTLQRLQAASANSRVQVCQRL